MSKPNRNTKLSAAKTTSVTPSTAPGTPARPSVAAAPSPAAVHTAAAPSTGAVSGASKAAAQSIPVQPPKAAAAPSSKSNHVQIELIKPEAKRVFVAGSFNGWKPESTPLKLAGNGRWVGDLNVQPGRHEYLFVVDGQWLPDPNAKETVANPYGGTNSVLVVRE